GQPDMTLDPFILQRKEEILQESQITLNAIRSLADPGVDDPFTDTATLSQAITAGILDAPHLRNNPFARGQMNTRIDNRGASISINPSDGQRITERDRIATLNLT
ncbi:MAG: methionine synthase, partial [Anaerolineales bacterium]|nr:methionine synthase [Anaerolineales bacterium]